MFAVELGGIVSRFDIKLKTQTSGKYFKSRFPLTEANNHLQLKTPSFSVLLGTKSTLILEIYRIKAVSK